MNGPRQLLAIVRPPGGFGDDAVSALGQVWTSELRVVDEVPRTAALVVVCGADAAAVADEARRRGLGAPVLGVAAQGARRARAAGLAPPLCWIVGLDELEPRYLGLSVRFALEVAARWRMAEQVHVLQPAADLGAAATVVSHEMNNVLTSVLLDAELLRIRMAASLRDFPRLAELDLLASDVYDGTRYLARVAADLSRVSRPTGRPTVVDPAALADTARRLCGEALRGVQVDVVITRPCDVRADEGRLTQVVVNLLRNAAQAMEGRPDAQVRVTIDSAGDEGTLRVADNGPGLAPWVREHLFEPWTTTRATGTGLGLALSRRFVSEMGGTLAWIPSDSGATFEVRLPRADAARPTLVPDYGTEPTRVLVVDDAELVRRSLSRSLGTLGSVDSASDLRSALVAVAAERYDAVLVDMNLTDGSGMRLWEESPAIRGRVAFLAGNYTAEEQGWLEERNIPHALKPLGAEEVRQLVFGLVERR